MQLLRLGLLMWVFVRLFGVWARLHARFSGTPLTIEGTAFECSVIRHKGRIRRVRVGIAAADGLRFVLRPERRIDRLGKWLGIAREYQTGDADFDERVYVLSDDRSLLHALAVDADLRSHVTSLLSTHTVRELHCNAGKLWVEAGSPGRTDKDTADEAVAGGLWRAVGDDLLAIRERLQPLTVSGWTAPRDPYVTREAIFYGVALALAVVAIACFFWTDALGLPRVLVFDRTEQLATYAALAAAVAGSVAALVLMSGSSRAHLVLLEILVTAVPAAWFLGRTGFAEYDMRADTHTPASYAARVTDRYVVRGRRGHRSYYLVIDRWPDPRIDNRLKVTSGLYDTVPDGSCVEIGLRAGRLGDPWLEYLRPIGTCPA